MTSSDLCGVPDPLTDSSGQPQEKSQYRQGIEPGPLARQSHRYSTMPTVPAYSLLVLETQNNLKNKRAKKNDLFVVREAEKKFGFFFCFLFCFMKTLWINCPVCCEEVFL